MFKAVEGKVTTCANVDYQFMHTTLSVRACSPEEGHSFSWPYSGEVWVDLSKCHSTLTLFTQNSLHPPFTFRVDVGLKVEFSAAAKSRDRTGAQLLRDFMRDFVKQQDAAEHDAWFRRQVQAGLDSANAGRLLSAEEVDAEFAIRRAETRRKLEVK